MRDNNSEFSSDYRKWFHSRNVSKSEIRWQALVEKYGIQVDSWLAKMWDLRFHWVPAFLKDTFVAGMTSSGRSESINSFFDGFVNSNTHLPEFIEQYSRALMSRRQAEERQDYLTMNSNPKLITRFPFEKTAADCYTAIMFKLFQAELHESMSCWYEMVSNNNAATIYVVGLCDEDKRKWWTVVYDESEGVTLRCECAKFETEGYFCKHILRIMQERHLTVIPEQYMLKRWTIGARYIMDNGVCTSKENENTVTPIMEWSLKALATKAAHKASSSIATYNECRSLLNGFMGKFDELCLMDNQFVPPDGIRSEVGSTVISSDMPGISIRDPQVVRTKGRPKIASRIPSGQTNSQKEKKRRTCSICLEKGHYMTTCPKKAKVCNI
ncbi:SWIM domain-containing protein [Cephalotus follicularis]|uniref:Protein FAR1-RELATED SEQUENCE n=1 Tax=Cephalotus follicularis TaxID=3775 RepID=A0A1Q3BU72_CEPFO|nr:SWIM domain-containing protein [Cephalotus follicularis]